MNKFSASKIHILGHMFLSRRKSRGEADGHKFCQKEFREAVLHTVIPWCKLASISPRQHFCDTAAALPAGLREQLLSPACLETSPTCSVTDLFSWTRAGGFPVWAPLLKHRMRPGKSSARGHCFRHIQQADLFVKYFLFYIQKGRQLPLRLEIYA